MTGPTARSVSQLLQRLRIAMCLQSRRATVPRRIGRTKGGLNSKLHAGHGRPLIMLLSEGQMSDYKGAALMLPALPKARETRGGGCAGAATFHDPQRLFYRQRSVLLDSAEGTVAPPHHRPTAFDKIEMHLSNMRSAPAVCPRAHLEPEPQRSRREGVQSRRSTYS